MPAGKVHTVCSLIVAGAGASAIVFNVGLAEATCVAGGALIGILAGPDCDSNGGNIADYYIRRYTGEIAEKVWDIVWWPYRKLCPHRGFVSHAPIVSTLIRLAYLAVWLAPFVWWFEIKVPRLETWHLWMIVGLMLSDVAHWFLDVLDDKLYGGRL